MFELEDLASKNGKGAKDLTLVAYLRE